MSQRSVSHLIIILAPFVFSFAFGLDIYIPIVPKMSEIFETSVSMVHLTLSLFLLMTGAGQLLIGPMSDLWGRKRIFYASSVCYAIGSLACAYSPTIYFFIFARLISALGSCGMLVTAFALVRDLFSEEESSKMYSFLNGAVGVSPTLAPIIGGYLASYFGWRSIFYFLFFIGASGLLITFFFIQETLPKEKRVPINKEIFQRYKNIYIHPLFFCFSMLAGIAEAVFFCFFSISPFIIIEILGIPTHQFGFYFAAFGSVIAFGGFASGKVVERLGTKTTIIIGIFLMFLGGFGMISWYYLYDLTLAGFLTPMVIACIGAMFLVGASAGEALEPFPETAGTAAAAFGSVEFGFSSLIGALLMQFSNTNTVPYGICILLLAVGASSFFLYALKIKKSLASIDLTLSTKKP